MNETSLARHVRRTNRNLLLVNLLVLAVVAVAIGANRYRYNVFAGPFEIDKDELFSITNPDAARRYYVTLEATEAIDADILGGSPLKVGSVTLGRSWLVSQSTFGVRTMHLSEIIWIYQKVTTQRVNFVPVGKTYAAIIVGEQGDPIELQLKQPAAEALLGEIARRVPWVVGGYSAEIEKLLRSNRAQLIQAVAQRRSQAMSQGPALGAWAS